MKRESIHQILRRIAPLTLERKAAKLSEMIEKEAPRSHRRAELVAALSSIVNRDLDRSNQRERTA